MKVIVLVFVLSLVNIFSVLSYPYRKGDKDTLTCGTKCIVSQNCTGACPVCRLGVCVGNGTCNSYCDPALGWKYYCYDGKCSNCDADSMSCKVSCGSYCTAEECPSSCRCDSNYCRKKCGSACEYNQDCSANYNECVRCINKVCIRPTGCGIPCQFCRNNTDGCTKCLRDSCVTGGCGSKCYYSPDCGGDGNCTQCNGRFGPDQYGLCTARCGGPCLTNTECAGNLTNCGLCDRGVCAPSRICGVQCMNDVGCAGNCRRCINGVCTKNAGCGEACDVNDQCDQEDPNCNLCINKKCGHP